MKTSRTPFAGLLLVAVLATGCTQTAAVQTVSPTDGSTGVTLRPNVIATFNVELDAASVTASSFTLVNDATGAAVAGTVEAGGKVATFRPSADLTGLTDYTATIEGAKAKGGKAMPRAHSWKFRTQAKPMAVTARTPTLATGVPQESNITVTFDAAINATTVTATSFSVTGPGTTLVSGARAVSGATLTFTPAEPLAVSTDYRVTVSTDVRGTGGEALAAPFTFTFRTASGPVTGGVAGFVTFDAINADDLSEGGNRLDYSSIVAKPARRIVVEAWDTGTNTLVSTTTTDDAGAYKLLIPDGTSVEVRAYAWLKATSYTPDAIAPSHCTGGAWDVRVVDNTQSKAQWGIKRTGATAPQADFDLHASTTWNGTSYTSRAGAPFFLADNALNAIERICEGDSTPALPLLNMNWSPNNVDAQGDKTQGQIITSHYTTEAGIGNLYILGKQDADTDEYDDHVVVHEFGHYLEDKLYRSDSIGGRHSMNDILDPRVAFGEGYGNAMSGLVLADPVYVDTYGTRQASGFQLDMRTVPTGNDRGVYSERSMQHFLYTLWDNRDLVVGSGSYDRIHTVLASDHTVTEALTNGQTFAAHYNARWGNDDGLYLLWGTVLDSPTNAFCVGSCTGSASGGADVWDSDNDLGVKYASARTYDGATKGADFWRLYKTLSGTGFASPGDPHDVLAPSGGYYNRFGMQRWYRFTSAGGGKTFRVSAAMSGATNVCTTGPDPDAIDLYLHELGNIINDPISNGLEGATTATCEQVSEASLTSGRTYVLIVSSYDGTTALTGYGITLQ